MGFASANPSSASAVGRFTSVIVSPMRVEWRSLMFPQNEPTSPTESAGTSSGCGRKTPTASTSVSRPVPIARMRIRDSSLPSMIRTSEVTPR